MRGIAAQASRLVVAGPVMERVYQKARLLAGTELPVVIVGETGTGKALIAALIHSASSRASAEMVTQLCAGLPAQVIEREFRGPSNDSVIDRHGPTRTLDSALGSTLFLDEIGELSLDAQAKFVRALDAHDARTGRYAAGPLGGFRVVAATTRNLRSEIAAGRFRADLFYRLAATQIHVPALRDRPDEIVGLAEAFLDVTLGVPRPGPVFSAGARRALKLHAWPGNVRELRQVMHTLAATYPRACISAEHVHECLTGFVPDDPVTFRPLTEEIQRLETLRIGQALAATRGNQKDAARLLQVPPTTLRNKAQRYALLKPERSFV